MRSRQNQEFVRWFPNGRWYVCRDRGRLIGPGFDTRAEAEEHIRKGGAMMYHRYDGRPGILSYRMSKGGV